MKETQIVKIESKKKRATHLINSTGPDVGLPLSDLKQFIFSISVCEIYIYITYYM